MSSNSESACTWEKRGNGKGGLAIFDVEHVLDPVLGSALAGVPPAQQTEGFDVGGGSLDVTAGVIHGCRDTSNKWLPTRFHTTVSYSTPIWLAEWFNKTALGHLYHFTSVHGVPEQSIEWCRVQIKQSFALSPAAESMFYESQSVVVLSRSRSGSREGSQECFEM